MILSRLGVFGCKATQSVPLEFLLMVGTSVLASFLTGDPLLPIGNQRCWSCRDAAPTERNSAFFLRIEQSVSGTGAGIPGV